MLLTTNQIWTDAIFRDLRTQSGIDATAAVSSNLHSSRARKDRSPRPKSARPVDRLTVDRVSLCSGKTFPGRRAAVLSFERRGLSSGGISWPAALSYAAENRSVADALLFAGAEPLEYREIRVAAMQAREHGFQVGVETSGLYPERLRSVRRESAWVRLHIDAPLDRVDQATGTARGVARVLSSLCTLVNSELAYECCTTWDSALLSRAGLEQIADDLSKIGVQCWRIRGVPAGVLTGSHARALGTRFQSFSVEPLS